MTESEMVATAIKRLPGKIYREVPIFSASCDVVFVADNEINTVEFKLKNWRQAINQAAKHKLAADRCWVCLLVAPDKAKIYAEQRGVGILDIEMQTIVNASKNYVWEPAKNQVLKYLEVQND
jgi:hypothetical protein